MHQETLNSVILHSLPGIVLLLKHGHSFISRSLFKLFVTFLWFCDDIELLIAHDRWLLILLNHSSVTFEALNCISIWCAKLALSQELQRIWFVDMVWRSLCEDLAAILDLILDCILALSTWIQWLVDWWISLFKDLLLYWSGSILVIIVAWKLLISKWPSEFFSVWTLQLFINFLRTQILSLRLIILRLVELWLWILWVKLMHWRVQGIRKRIKIFWFTVVGSIGKTHSLIWSKSWVVFGE